MSKATDRAAARRKIELLKAARTHRSRPKSTQRLVEEQRERAHPLWRATWQEIERLDATIKRLQEFIFAPYSDGLFVVANQMITYYEFLREQLLMHEEYRAADPRELYSSTSRDHVGLR